MSGLCGLVQWNPKVEIWTSGSMSFVVAISVTIDCFVFIFPENEVQTRGSLSALLAAFIVPVCACVRVRAELVKRFNTCLWLLLKHCIFQFKRFMCYKTFVDERI